MAHASIMTFNDPNEAIRVKTDNGKVYIYWQVGTYLALNQAETLQLRDDLSRAITETATAGDGGTATAGDGGTATAGYNGELRIRWYDREASRYRTAIAYVGENGIEADAAYRLDDEHQFVKVTA